MDPSKPFTHVLVPTDFGDSSSRALALAVEVAKKYGAALTLLHTYEIPSYAGPGSFVAPVDFLTPVREAAEAVLKQELEKLRKELPNANGIVRFGIPWEEIAREIGLTHADLVVMGTHGRRGLSHALLGSVAERTVRTSPVPVLIVH